MKYFSFSFFALLLSIQAYTQQNYVKGYILKSQSDTLYGYIDERNYIFNSLYCDFRLTEKGESHRYLPGEIFGYRISGKSYYVSRKLNLEGKNGYVFLEFLIDGQMDVFFMQDENKKNHFFASKNDSDVYELKYSAETVYSDQKVFLKENKEYIGTLKVLTNDYPEFTKEIEKPYKLKQTNLVNLAEKYHNYVCTDKQCVVYHKKQPVKVIIEPEIGYKWTLRHKSYYSPLNFQYYGTNILFNSPELNEKVYLGIGFIYKGKFQEYEEQEESWPHARIPIVVAYYNNKKGISFSCSGSYNFELVRRSTEKTIWDSGQSISVSPGIKYGFEKVSLVLYGDITFMWRSSMGLGLKTSFVL